MAAVVFVGNIVRLLAWRGQFKYSGGGLVTQKRRDWRGFQGRRFGTAPRKREETPSGERIYAIGHLDCAKTRIEKYPE